MNQSNNPTCRKCSGKCKQSKAFKPFGLCPTDGQQGVYLQDAANGLIDCYKCEKCGHSFTVGQSEIIIKDETSRIGGRYTGFPSIIPTENKTPDLERRMKQFEKDFLKKKP